MTMMCHFAHTEREVKKKMERTNLRIFRVKNKLSQEQMAKRIGVTRATYSAIEKGTRNGKQTFWVKFQNAFNISDNDLWGYIKTDEN